MTTEKLNADQIKARVIKVVESILKMARAESDTSDSEMDWGTDLFNDLGIDSVEVLDVIGALETEFNLTLKPEEAATKRTIKDIVEYIEENLNK